MINLLGKNRADANVRGLELLYERNMRLRNVPGSREQLQIVRWQSMNRQS